MTLHFNSTEPSTVDATSQSIIRSARKACALVAALAGSPCWAGESPAEDESAELQAEFTYTGELWRNTHGGLRTGGRYLDNIDVIATWNPDPAATPLGDSQVHLHVLHNNSQRLSEDLIGDLQGVSNIDAPKALRLYEAWYEKRFGPRTGDSQGSSWRFGLYDLNSEFDAIETAGLFLNSSHGIGPDFAQSGANGPSIFPVTGLALRIAMPINEQLTSRFAVLDGVPGDPDSSGSHSLDLGGDEGALIVAELDAAVREASRVFAGGWIYSEEAEVLLAGIEEPASERSRAAGGYIGAETALGQQLRAFLRVGMASEAVHAISRYVGLGVTWQLPGDLESVIGLAVAHARTSGAYRRLLASEDRIGRTAETAIEATAQFALRGGFTLQPNLQYIINPGADSALHDAFVVGLRFSWSKQW